jgi:glycosyltransferase involved in cell wall biosynthesis
MRVIIVTPDQSDNSIGRTYCLWLIARALGWDTIVAAVRGESIWEPLKDSLFAQNVSCLPKENRLAIDELRRLAEQADVMIALKPLPESFGLARRACETTGTPLVLDIDDPDLDAMLRRRASLMRRVAKWIAKPGTMIRALYLQRLSQRFPRFVSNPYLQQTYGGTILPHVRDPDVVVHKHVSDKPRVVFVGTNRPHKGLDLLRAAVARLATKGFTLTVTDQAPEDAQPWETWLEGNDFQAGLALVSDSDIVALPSRNTPWAWGQLPAKLIGAMMSGVPTVVSNIEPMPWAVGNAGLVIDPDNEDELVSALESLTSPTIREELGRAARSRAEALFSVDANIDVFARVLTQAANGRG